MNYDILGNLNYMEMVIKETLRLAPIVPLLGRTTTGDITISNCVIPAGVGILISPYSIHRDSNIWGSNADKFNPDNFLPEKMSERHPATFIPFSYGPRNCIG